MAYNHRMYLLARGLIFLYVAVFITILVGCSSREELPAVDEALPEDIIEKRVPRDLLAEFSGDIGRDVGWIRCFDYDQDWEKLSQQMAHKLAKLEYRDAAASWLPDFIADTGIPQEHAAQMLKVYTSSSGQGIVMAMNLAYVRSISSKSFDTAGDYLVMTGYAL